MKRKLLGYLFLFVVAILTIAIVYIWQAPNTIAPTTTEQGNLTETNRPVDTSDWKIYNDSKNRFQFLYPAEWKYSALPDSESIGFYLIEEASNEYLQYHVVAKVINVDSEMWLKNLGDVGFVEKTWVNGYTAILVTGIPMHIPSDAMLVYKDNMLIEFMDVGQIHSSDGIFQAIVDTIR